MLQLALLSFLTVCLVVDIMHGTMQRMLTRVSCFMLFFVELMGILLIHRNSLSSSSCHTFLSDIYMSKLYFMLINLKLALTVPL